MKQLSNKDKLNYVYRVSTRCETLEHFRIVRSWVDKMPLQGNWAVCDDVMLGAVDIAQQNVFNWDEE